VTFFYCKIPHAYAKKQRQGIKLTPEPLNSQQII